MILENVHLLAIKFTKMMATVLEITEPQDSIHLQVYLKWTTVR